MRHGASKMRVSDMRIVGDAGLKHEKVFVLISIRSLRKNDLDSYLRTANERRSAEKFYSR